MDTVIKVTTSDVLSVQEAANAIGCSRLAVYRWIEKGKIIGLRFGGILYVPVSEVERVKEGNNQTPTDSLLTGLRQRQAAFQKGTEVEQGGGESVPSSEAEG